MPIVSTPLPIVQLVRPLQLLKAYWPILVTLSGMSMLVRLRQPLKAPPPVYNPPLILVTQLPIVQLVIAVY